jgi:hypothetical protein
VRGKVVRNVDGGARGALVQHGWPLWFLERGVIGKLSASPCVGNANRR